MNNEIEINKDWKVGSDEHCLILYKKGRTIGYYPHLRALLAAVQDKEIRGNLNNLPRLLELQGELLAAIVKFKNLPNHKL